MIDSLKQMEVDQMIEREKYIEDRKDNRTKLQGTQQSEMIDQRKFDLLPTNFESTVTNFIGLGGFYYVRKRNKKA